MGARRGLNSQPAPFLSFSFILSYITPRLNFFTSSAVPVPVHPILRCSWFKFLFFHTLCIYCRSSGIRTHSLSRLALSCLPVHSRSSTNSHNNPPSQRLGVLLDFHDSYRLLDLRSLELVGLHRVNLMTSTTDHLPK